MTSADFEYTASLVTADQRLLARLSGTPWASRALSLHDLEAMN